MRALFSWSIQEDDPQAKQIRAVIAACFSPSPLKPLTRYTAQVDVHDVSDFERIGRLLIQALRPYPNRACAVFSLNDENAPLYVLPIVDSARMLV